MVPINNRINVGWGDQGCTGHQCSKHQCSEPQWIGYQWIGAIALALVLATACSPKQEVNQTSEPEATPETSSLPTPQSAITVPPTPVPETTPKVDPLPIEKAPEPLPVIPTTPIKTSPSSSSGASVPKNSATMLAKGTFIAGEHNTKGSFTIMDDEGTPIIQFGDDFQTTQGPDLFVILHVADDVFATTSPPSYGLKNGDYVAIAPLKAPQGTQSYSIPAAIILDNYSSLAIWCRQFNATFGSAPLELFPE